jgi:hypothetical protein
LDLDYSGWRTFEPWSWDRDRDIYIHAFGIPILRRDIPGYFTEDYYNALKMYNRFKRFGLPFGGGWAEQPEWYIELVEAFMEVEERAQSHRAKEAESKWQSRKS